MKQVKINKLIFIIFTIFFIFISCLKKDAVVENNNVSVYTKIKENRDNADSLKVDIIKLKKSNDNLKKEISLLNKQNNTLESTNRKNKVAIFTIVFAVILSFFIGYTFNKIIPFIRKKQDLTTDDGNFKNDINNSENYEKSILEHKAIKLKKVSRELDDVNNKYDELKKENDELKKENDELKKENDELKKKSIDQKNPEVEKKVFYFTIPDKAGKFNSNKASVDRKENSFYKIEVNENKKDGELSYCNYDRMSRAIDNWQSYLLPVCDINVDLTEKKYNILEQEKSGRVIFEGDSWRIDSNNKIKLKFH